MREAAEKNGGSEGTTTQSGHRRVWRVRRERAGPGTEAGTATETENGREHERGTGTESRRVWPEWRHC